MRKRLLAQAISTPANRLLAANLVFILGIAAASWLPYRLIRQEGVWLAGMIVSAVVAMWLSPKTKARYCSVALFLLAAAFWRYSVSFPAATSDQIWRYNEKKAAFSGHIAAEPSSSQEDQRLVVAAERLSDPEKRQVKGLVLVVAGFERHYAYGDPVRISCTLRTPAPVQDFAYDRYLAKQGVYSICYMPSISVTGRRDMTVGQRMMSGLLVIKDQARKRIESSLSEPQASLVKGMVLGDQRGISKEVQEDFSRSGLSHIVAISGMNMTILAAIFVEAFLMFGLYRRPAIIGAGVALWLYTALIGWPASAVRAVILSSLFLLASYLGRLADLPRALAIAATAMLLANPRLLRDDLGFDLSFLAFIGVVYLVPLLDRITLWPKDFLPKARELVWLTLAAQILAWPLLAVAFGQVSLIAPLANVLVVWTLPLIMLVALAALPLSAVWPFAGKALLLFPGWLSGFAAAVAHLTARPGWAAMKTNGLSLWGTAAYYLLAVYLYFRLSNRIKEESQPSL